MITKKLENMWLYLQQACAMRSPGPDSGPLTVANVDDFAERIGDRFEDPALAATSRLSAPHNTWVWAEAESATADDARYAVAAVVDHWIARH